MKETRLLQDDLAKPARPIGCSQLMPEDGGSTRLRTARGFVLLEVMVALTLLALVLTPLAAMVFQITARSHRIVGSNFRNAVLLDEVNYAESLPYDSLTTGSVITTYTAQPYPHSVTVGITEVSVGQSGRMKKIKLIITPANRLYRSDTATFTRTKVNKPSLFSEDDQ